MKSNGNYEESPKRIEKTTEALWRFLWGLVYLLFIPTLVTVMFFFIFGYSIVLFSGHEDIVTTLALSAIMFLVSILIFYRPFDKYRKKSIFLNKVNNPRARIHILFLITLISLAYTPIFLIFVPEYQEELTLLPLITFILTYNSVYLYFSSQPIDFFNISESRFKNFNRLKDTIKQPYNLIIFVNYIILMAFLSITFDMQIPIFGIEIDISWFLAFISNVLFYLITLSTTKPHIKKIENSISNQENFLEDLVLYKQAFVKSVVRLDFLILILIPFGVLSVFFRSIGLNAVINAIFITLILLIFNFKLDNYLKSYYFKQLNRLNPNKYATRDVGVKWNFFLTILFIILIPSYIFYYTQYFYGIFYFNLLALLIIYFITRTEEKYDYLPKEYAKHLHLIIVIFLSAIISFQIVPILPYPNIFINFVIFFILLYFSLELFVKFGYYNRKNLLIVQNVLAIASFYCIAFLFFKDIAFGPSPIGTVNTLMVNYILPGLIGSLFSLYLLYFRQFYKKSWKTLRISVICNILTIISLSFYLLNITPNVSDLIVSVIGFSILYIVLTGFNYLIHLFNKQNLASNVYSTMWVLDLSIFSAMLFNTLTSEINLLTILPDFLVLSALILFTLWFGKKIGKISENNYFRLFNINGFLLILEIFILSSQFLIEEVFPPQVEYKVLAYFISTCITAFIVNIGAPSKSASIKKAKNFLNIFTVIFGWFLLEMFYFLFNYQNLYFLYGLIITSSLITALPIGFLVLVKILDKKRLLDYLYLILNVIWLTSLSFIIHFIVANGIDLFFGITLILLALIISYMGIGKLGVKLGYISNEFYLRFVKIMYYPIGILLFLVFFSFSLDLTGDPFISFLIATSILSAMTNFAHLIFKTTAKINFRITLLTLFYAVFYASFLLIQSLLLIHYSFYEWFVYLYFSIILIQLMFYIPFGYLTVKRSIKKAILFKYSYYSLYSLILLVFLLISSFFFYLFYSFIGLYTLGLIADVIYITIALYYHIKRGLTKHYLPVIHLSKKAAILLYSTLFSEFYAFLLTMTLLFFPQPWQLWELWLSSYLAFIIISLIIMALASKLIIFSIDFSRRINVISLFFTSILAAYFSENFVSMFFVNVFLQWDFIILGFLTFSLLPLYYSINRNMFQRFINKKSVYVDGVLISLSIIVLPTFFAIEFSLFPTSLLYIIISTIFLTYCFLKYLEHVFDELNIKQGQRIALKTIQLICWNSLSVIIAYTVFTTFNPGILNQMFYLVLCASSITFFIINLNSLPIIEDIKQRVFENEELKIDYYKIYKIYEFYKNVSFFAFIFSLSGLISTLLSPLSYLLGDLIPLFFLTPELIQFELFFLFSLLFLLITQNIEIEYQKSRIWIILISWLIIKGTICGYIYSYFIESPILSWSLSILIFSVFSPITLHFIRKIRLVFGTTSKIVNSVLVISFYGSLLTLYLIYFWSLRTIPFFAENILLFWFLLISNSIIYFDYVIMRLRNIFEGEFEFNLLKLYFKSSLVLCLFLFFNFYLNIVLWFISAIILLNRRNNNVVIKYMIYILFSLSLYIYLIIDFSFLLPLEWRYLTIMLTLSFISILFISILSNYRKANDLEKFSIYILLSFLSFVSFSLIPMFSIIPGLLYNGSFSLLIFLALTGNYFYHKRDSRYKLFIRPCAVLAVFDFTSFLFYGLLFNFPPFSPDFQQILSFTSTFSLTGLTFVSLYNQSPQRFRSVSFFIVLPLLTLSIPTFVYYFIFASFPLLRTSVIPLTISLNIGIVFFYIAIGLYQWRFSRAIWKTGFWAWILLPIVNYAIIDQSLADLSLRSLELFGFINIPASTLLAITICIIISFPFWYTWIKAHFSTILFGTWIINLGLLYWFSQSLFYRNQLLINSSFLIFAFILLMPLVYKLKIWRVLMAFWILFTIIMISFIDFFFSGLETQMVLSIDISVSGLSIIFLSYFPNMKNRRNLSLLVAYFVLMAGISMMIYQVILITVFPDDPLGALYFTMIIISVSSFSSRILKVNKVLMNFLISWTLVISFSLMTYHIYSKFLPFDIGALYLSLAVGGLTFFIFNRYKMLWGPYENFMPISSMIAFIAISLGTSLSISSILMNVISINPWFLIVAVFLFINIIFLSFKLKKYRFILSYLLPIPVTSLILYVLLFFEPLNDVVILSTIGILTYCVVNQLVKVNVKFKALLRLILYLDSFVLSLLLLPFPDLSLNFFISMSILFILTTFDNLLSKKRKYWYIVLVNLISYISSSIFLFWYLNVIYLAQFEYMIWLNSFIFILLQKYTVYAFYTILKSLNKYDPEKLVRYKLILNYSLSNALYILISLYGSLSLGSMFTESFSLVAPASVFLGLMIFCLFYFILNSIFNRKLKSKLRGGIRSSLFIAFQVSLFGLWAFSFGLFNLFYIMLIMIIETVLMYYTFDLIFSTIHKESEKRIFEYVPFLTYLLYLELSIFSFAWLYIYIIPLDVFYSSIYTILIFFVLTLIDLGIVKKVNIKLMKLSHFVSYTILSVLIFNVALDFLILQLNPIIFNLIIILIMQFYTVRSLFSLLSHYNWFNNVKALRVKQMVNNILINSIFVLLSLLGSQLISTYIFQFYDVFLYFLFFSFFIFFLNGTINRTIEKSLRVKYLLAPSYIAMQIFSFSLLVEMTLLSDANLFIFWSSFIALIETVMSIYPLKIMRKYAKTEARKAFISKLFKVVDFCLYLEITILTFGIFYYNLGQEPFQSLLYSQLVLFGLSLFEIFVFKSLREKFGYVMHLISYLIISGSLVYIIFIFTLSEFLLLPIILMQFYSNFAYFKMKRDLNPEKTEISQKWAVRRQRIIGNTFYVVLLFLVSRVLLLSSEFDIFISLFLISLLLHIITLFDRAILIFLGRLSMPLIVISLIIINIISIPALMTWILTTDLSYRLIPLVIIIVEIELLYLAKLTNKWRNFKNPLISVLYFNLSSWPVYFILIDFSVQSTLIDFNLILLSMFLLFIMVKIDKAVKALSAKVSKPISSIALLILGFGIPVDLFILLHSYNPDGIVLNIALSALIGTIELGIIKKPYKRKRGISFIYTLSLLVEVLIITQEINIVSLGYSVLVIGTLIYLFMFMLEELKEFFSHIVDYISRGFKAIKSFINRTITAFFNFLKKHYTFLKIMLAAIIGGLLGYSSTVIPIFGFYLPPYNYAPLFGLAVFGLIFGLFPGTKTDDPDKIFRTRMIRFSTVWFGITIFIFMIIIPVIPNFMPDPLSQLLFQAVLILSSFLILGLIVAIYVWRIEKKQRISIKWRLYITVVLIILIIIWGILFFMLYLTST